RGQDEVRLPCDFKRNSVSVSPTARLALPKSEKEFLLSFQMWYIEIATNLPMAFSNSRLRKIQVIGFVAPRAAI
ncbi:MAG: hypothetical protein COU40_00840, partial [Candidatus Moranbacteria bacterium CG10_big_fil_rev_8_21_14_0_10_35_21]